MKRTPSLFVDPGVAPLLTELPMTIHARQVGLVPSLPPQSQCFIRKDFRQAHCAEVYSFHPNLPSFTAGSTPRAVVG